MIGARPERARAGGEQARSRQRVAFAALRHRDYRAYFIGIMLSMMGDNIEHVISYWVIYQAFQSPLLGGFAVISHWTPHLLFGVYFGGLADRFDCRKIIQVSQALFIGASLGWGLLFLTGSLEVWHAVVLLIAHGMAGALWSPAGQVLIHDIVGREHLQSAVRLSSTGRQLGMLAGPAVGGGLMLALGPAWGLLANALVYLPLTLWLARVPYSGHRRETAAEGAAPADGRPRAALSLPDAPRALRELSANRTIMAMVALTGFSSLLVGNAYQAQMPAYARALGADDAGLGYSALFAANAVGAVLGGLLLEGGRLLPPHPTTAVLLAGGWCLSIIGFAVAPGFGVAFASLMLSGVLMLAFSSMAQTLVQLLAPDHLRGRAVGLLSMAQQGLRVGSGISVGVLGSFIGIHWSLGLSAAVLLGITLGLLGLVLRGERRSVAAHV